MTKGTLKHAEEEIALEHFFKFINGGNTVGGLLISLLLKATDSYCHFLSWLERENGEPGQSPQKVFETKPFHVREAPFLKREGIAKRTLLFFC